MSEPTQTPPPAPDAHEGRLATSDKRQTSRLWTSLSWGALLLFSFGLLLVWMLQTQTGTRAALVLAEKISAGSLTMTDVHGTLGGSLEIGQFNFRSKTLIVEGEGVHMQWQASDLIRAHVQIRQMQLSSLTIASASDPHAAQMPAGLHLPFTLDANNLALGRLRIATLQPDGTQVDDVVLSALSGRLSYQQQQYRLQTQLTTPWGKVQGHAVLAEQRPFPLRADMDWQGQAQATLPPLLVQGLVSGNLQELQIALKAQAGQQQGRAVALQGQAQLRIAPYAPHTAQVLRSLTLDVQHFNPAEWQKDAPQADMLLHASVLPETGVAADKTAPVLAGEISVRNQRAGAWNAQALPLRALTTKLRWAGELLSFQQLNIALNGNGSVAGHAEVQWKENKPTADVQLQLSDIDLKQLDQRLHSSRIKGSVNVQTASQTATKSTAQASVLMQAQLSDGQASLHAEAGYQHTNGLLTLSKFDWQAANAHIKGQGELALNGLQAYSFQGSLSNFDPARWLDTPPGHLQAEFSAKGQLQPQLQLHFTLPRLQGDYAGNPVKGSADLQWQRGQQVQVRQFDLQWGKNQLDAKGAWGNVSDVLNIHLDAPELASINPLTAPWQLSLGGSLKASASLRGRFNDLAGQLDAQGQQLQIHFKEKQLQIASLTGKLDMGSGSQGKLDGEILLQQVSGDLPALPQQAIVDAAAPTDDVTVFQQLRLQLHGNREKHLLELDAAMPGQQLHAAASGALQAAKNKNDPAWNWNGQLQALSLNGKPDLSLENPAPMQLSAQSFHLGGLRLRSVLGTLALDTLDWSPGSLITQGQLSNAHVISIANLIRPQYVVSGNMQVNAQWQLRLKDSAQGDIRVQRQSGDLRFNDPEGTGTPVALGIRDLQMQLKTGGLIPGTDSERLALTLNADGTRLGQWQLQANTALTQKNGNWTVLPEAALGGHVNAAVPDLQWLGTWLNPGLVMKGRLTLAANLLGSVGKPRFRADIQGRELEVAFASEGLLLPNGILDAQLEGAHLKVSRLEFSNTVNMLPHHARFQGSDLLGKKGEFKASGDVDMDQETGTIQASWQQFPLLQRKDRWLVVSGNANIVEANKIWSLIGQLKADGAYFKLPKLPPPSLSSDVIVTRSQDKKAALAKETVAPKRAIKTRVDVNFDMGQKFVFVGRGLDTGLTGSLRLRSSDGSPLQASGSIYTVGGVYEGYGQQLAIERGILNFQGPPANPGLNIRALRQGLAVEAGVEIVGTVAAPQVRLVSEPAVPDAEKLSWLVLGRGSDQLAGGDASLLMSAASAIFGGDGSRNVPRDIVQGLGFDEFSIGAAGSSSGSRLPGQTVAGSTGVSAGSSDQVVSVGKRLMPGLVLSVERGLSDASGAIKLSWQLTRRISVTGRTGSESAVDVNYTFSFN
ncbi:MAG: translocation/assembly module TamB domain-containing protein [Burkholderiales bacterium]|nr:translocation/assembly module TamB domain-containing protein [Burkholderiales bacterium]